MQTGTTFVGTSREVVQAFLSTVVVVDDRAYFEKPAGVAPVSVVVTPGKVGSVREQITPPVAAKLPIELNEVAPVVNAAVSEAKVTEDHNLDAKAVIDIFAGIGVVCSVMRPTSDELNGLGDLVMKVGGNADVIILDWVLHEATLGQKTLDLIERLTGDTAENRSRARLIVIYTAESNLNQIAQAIRARLRLEEPTSGNSLTVISGGTRICIYNKFGNLAAPIGGDRAKKPSELPTVVVAEFAEMTKGLLSNVAIRSITAVRNNTFQLLRRFDPALDASYVTQSALISPEKAEEQIAALVVSEIQEILEDEDVGASADFKQIQMWLSDQEQLGLSFPATRNLSAEQYRAGLLRLIEKGIGDDEIKALKTDHTGFANTIIGGGKKKPSGYVREALTNILSKHLPEGLESDERFTMLMSLRHRYEDPAPMLTLGTIIATAGDNPEYMLCFQPLCDSVRLAMSRSFGFLPLSKAANSKSCDLIVRHAGSLQFLAIKFNPFRLQMISFAPTKDQKVLGTADGAGFSFTSDDGRSFQWVADLKPAHAQRMANNFATTFSRVGLYESEWNRLGVQSGPED